MSTEKPDYYGDYPHFTVGRVDQWGESGYFVADGLVYEYNEDRKDQYCHVGHSWSPAEFIAYAQKVEITIPASIMKLLE